VTELFLDCFQMQTPAPELVPGRPRREWMDHFTDRQPYRCLPLTMANSTGWDLLCPFDLTIEWDGGPMEENIKFSSDTANVYIDGFVQSHFRSGIVTFHTGYLFRTSPGWAVWCMGPPNQPKDGIYALSGLVETDWLPFPFTMNWQMTRPGSVSFNKGESFCFFTVSEHPRLEAVVPRLRGIESEPALEKDYEQWKTSRGDFIKKLSQRDPETIKSGWQRHYMRGQRPSGEAAEMQHLTKRRLQAPKADEQNQK